jgi:hypothetical protein
MSDRITDDFMADLEAKHAKIENDYRPTCATVNYGNGCPGATDDSTAFWRAAVDCVPAMIAELKERRALDLTAEDREALGYARDVLDNDQNGHDVSRALAILSRLVKGAP